MRTKNGARRTSIVGSFHEPAFRSQVLVDVVQRSLFFTFPATFGLNSLTQRPHLNIPFIASPRGFGPPVATRSPRPRERQNSPARSLATEKQRPSIPKLERRRKWRPVNAHHSSSLLFSASAFFPHFR